MSIACPFYVLVETAAGYILLDIVEFDEIASMSPEMQRALGDAANFLRCVKLKVLATVNGARPRVSHVKRRHLSRSCQLRWHWRISMRLASTRFLGAW